MKKKFRREKDRKGKGGFVWEVVFPVSNTMTERLQSFCVNFIGQNVTDLICYIFFTLVLRADRNYTWFWVSKVLCFEGSLSPFPRCSLCQLICLLYFFFFFNILSHLPWQFKQARSRLSNTLLVFLEVIIWPVFWVGK